MVTIHFQVINKYIFGIYTIDTISGWKNQNLLESNQRPPSILSGILLCSQCLCNAFQEWKMKSAGARSSNGLQGFDMKI